MAGPLLCCLLAALPATLSGQQAQPPAAAARDTALPPSFEVVTRARIVMDSAATAGRDLAQLALVTGMAAELQESTRRHAELQTLLSALLDTDYVRPERLSRVRDQALLEDQRLEGLRNRVVERLDQLGGMRARWLERQRFWRAWQAALRTDPDYPVVASELEQTILRIQAVLDSVAAVTTSLITVQQRTAQLRAATDEIANVVATVRAERRRALLQRTEPVLLSAAHRGQLARQAWRAPAPDVADRASAYLAFLREYAGMLAFHMGLVVLLALIARRIQGAARGDAAWSGLLEYPWTLAVFASAVLALQRVVLAPPLWDVLLWTLLGLTGAVLARRLFPRTALRRAVYLLAAFYPVFLLLEIARFPAPLLRILMAAAAAVALGLFITAARADGAATETRARSFVDEIRRVWPFRVGALIWAAVFAATVLGYDTLARWVTHAAVTSAAVLFVVVLLIVVLRGALASVLRYETRGRSTLRRIGLPLVQRLMMLLQVIMVTAAALVLLDIWELSPSPFATWQRFIRFGIDLGPLQLTVGRLLFGLAVIYFAILASWLFRTLSQSEFYRQWDLDRGVGDSISTLVHYVLITLGVIFALGILGVELQNFAIVAGALGIGIGFGLQNVVNNFVSGLILLFERPVRVGDTVVVDGEWGTITKIGLRSTILLTFDQSEMIVPNADLISEKVTNWTLTTPIARIILPVGVAYGSNIAQVLDILRAAGNAHESVLTEPGPQALFVGFGDSSLDFEIRCWIRQIRLRLEVRSVVLTDVQRRLAEAGIEIPFPQRDLHLRSVAPGVVLPRA
jgi:potassium-dependent mechanosensitive channel